MSNFKEFPRGEHGFSSQEKAEQQFGFEGFPAADAILVMAGDLEKRRGKVVPGVESKMRSLAALEMLREGVVRKIVLAGGRVKSPKTGVTEVPEKAVSEYMEEYLEPYLKRYGIPRDSIIVENLSVNTNENLAKALEVMEEHGVKKFYLQTSEYHLPRSEQLLRNVLGRMEDTELENIGSIATEKALRERSSHYERLLSHFEFPSSLKESPKEALYKGLRELLRRCLIFVDPKDKIATRLAHFVRE
ncbi:YdcF family protein [Candidatus Parcubacteria bacterium]|nr:MAG: YdcF family protein [Candidatus Parcubacteria bacterium]